MLWRIKSIDLTISFSSIIKLYVAKFSQLSFHYFMIYLCGADAADSVDVALLHIIAGPPVWYHQAAAANDS